MLKVYDLIQELSKCDADAEVKFHTNMDLSITADNGKEINGSLEGEMEYEDVYVSDKTGAVTIELRY